MKKNQQIIFGVVVLILVAFLVVVFLIPPTTTPEEGYENECVNAEAKTKEIASGDQVLLCSGQTAKLGAYELTVTGSGDGKTIEVKYPGNSGLSTSSFPLNNEGLKTIFVEWKVKDSFENGVVLSIMDATVEASLEGSDPRFVTLEDGESVSVINPAMKVGVTTANDGKDYFCVLGEELNCNTLFPLNTVRAVSDGNSYIVEFVTPAESDYVFNVYDEEVSQ
jgi:hypothetical protein